MIKNYQDLYKTTKITKKNKELFINIFLMLKNLFVHYFNFQNFNIHCHLNTGYKDILALSKNRHINFQNTEKWATNDIHASGTAIRFREL